MLGIAETANAAIGGSIDTSALQAQYASALRQVLSQSAVRGAVVLVCEDLHWADAPSCQVLQRVLAALSEARVLFCATARPDPETPGWEFIETLHAQPGAPAVQIQLTPLSDDDAQAMLEDLAPGTLPAQAQSLVLSRAEGNPLFVEELTRMLIERGDLKREGDQWVLTRELHALDVPNTLQGVLMARVDRLPPHARQLLQIASVLGREFPLEILERVTATLRER